MAGVSMLLLLQIIITLDGATKSKYACNLFQAKRNPLSELYAVFDTKHPPLIKRKEQIVIPMASCASWLPFT